MRYFWIMIKFHKFMEDHCQKSNTIMSQTIRPKRAIRLLYNYIWRIFKPIFLDIIFWGRILISAYNTNRKFSRMGEWPLATSGLVIIIIIIIIILLNTLGSKDPGLSGR